ncbi:hypothetical protein CS053_11015 [Rhodanobacter glycinis]|uniref:Uncharacterized protein n=1 Tax=Rhodanobacter glycinis TaxID=582702 RepID=A0A5B9E497_9GAMM|nr:O-methyltransferase [Rhodanobacter glycinis]QEE24966.1 hypothetical protein CS053_11015 [Rhodanobacter glycinis]
MMRDLFSRLFPFSPLTDYQYIGFGSKYFVDFTLLHRHLHIDKMVSIEADATNQARYHFNRPYECIKMAFGKASNVLPTLDFSRRSIVWLDYDGRFEKFMLDDVALLAEKVISGSVICLSYNTLPYELPILRDEYKNLHEGYYRQKFSELTGTESIPSDFDERGWSRAAKFSGFLRQAVITRLERVIALRNSQFSQDEDGKRLSAKQIMFFDYADGQPMSTVGFVLVSKDEESRLVDGRFDDFHFYRDGSESYEIRTSNLTIKEMRYLTEHMPQSPGALALPPGIFASSDVQAFCENYKYFPAFTEIEVY